METTTTTVQSVTGSALVSAVERFWDHLVQRHPELPAHVIVITGTGKITGGLIRGHWAIGRWASGDGAKLPELFISGERMADGGRGVATTIIHEAAHALLQARGDLTGGTSRQGRYHTRKGFAAAAEELGLVAPTAADPTLGFSDCTMPDATAELYAAEIAELDAALGATIPTRTTGELIAAAIAIGALMGGTVAIVPWWNEMSPMALWGTLGGRTAAPRKPRRVAIKVRVACECRSFLVKEEDAELWEDMTCRRCESDLVVG